VQQILGLIHVNGVDQYVTESLDFVHLAMFTLTGKLSVVAIFSSGSSVRQAKLGAQMVRIRNFSP
jgi:hypothetical protein